LSDRTITITLINAPHPCPKCAACQAMVARLQERHPGRIEFRQIQADGPEAADFGVIMPPMLLLGDFIVSAGNVPRETGLTKLVERELQEAAS